MCRNDKLAAQASMASGKEAINAYDSAYGKYAPKNAWGSSPTPYGGQQQVIPNPMK